MKLLGDGPQEFSLEQVINEEIQGDYIYMYPPRQAYGRVDTDRAVLAVRDSLSITSADPLNLYLHFPFCKQICSFCNLYAIAVGPGRDFSEYVDAIAEEIRLWASRLQGRRVDTIYFGGGTPSLLPPAQFDRLLATMELSWNFKRDDVAEVALEVAPDTVDLKKLQALRSAGISRVNLGVQSSNDGELKSIGRRHGYMRAHESVENALEAGFKNVCVDLIYGLPLQEMDDWGQSVDRVCNLRPPTVCAYPLTVRPLTGYARRGITIVGSEQYKKYQYALEILSGAGYEQETHVRYILPGVGGYRQKANHWAGQDVVGMGAGARGYLRNVDYRNGYSLSPRRRALSQYLGNIASGVNPIREGFMLNRDERIRRAIILGLLHLDRDAFKLSFRVDPVNRFPAVFSELRALELVHIEDRHIALTSLGRKYRDLIVQRFFSETVWRRIRDFDYNE